MNAKANQNIAIALIGVMSVIVVIAVIGNTSIIPDAAGFETIMHAIKVGSIIK